MIKKDINYTENRLKKREKDSKYTDKQIKERQRKRTMTQTNRWNFEVREREREQIHRQTD